MKLGTLTGDSEEAVVTGFAIDHRKVAPGTVFGAFQGYSVNGEDFVPQAIARRHAEGGRDGTREGRSSGARFPAGTPGSSPRKRPRRR